MYADDSYLTYAGSYVHNIQFYLNPARFRTVHNWLRANKLILHMTKTRQRLSNLTDSPTITVDNVQISQVATAKSLGVTIDNNI